LALRPPRAHRIRRGRPSRRGQALDPSPYRERPGRSPRSQDRRGFNAELERYWNWLSKGNAADNTRGYEEGRRKARALGFEYCENEQLLGLPAEARLDRLEALFSGGMANEPVARAALLGTEKKPALKVSELFHEYETISQVEIRDQSSGQLRIWRNTRKRAVSNFHSVIGDIPISELTADHAITYCEWWHESVIAEETNPKTANKDMGVLSRMLKELNIRRPIFLRDCASKGEVQAARMPFTADFIQNQLLAEGALDGLNEEARLVLYVVADTGMRPSEVVNLQLHRIVRTNPS
jgi:hypothetical protein